METAPKDWPIQLSHLVEKSSNCLGVPASLGRGWPFPSKVCIFASIQGVLNRLSYLISPFQILAPSSLELGPLFPMASGSVELIALYMALTPLSSSGDVPSYPVPSS